MKQKGAHSLHKVNLRKFAFLALQETAPAFPPPASQPARQSFALTAQGVIPQTLLINFPQRRGPHRQKGRKRTVLKTTLCGRRARIANKKQRSALSAALADPKEFRGCAARGGRRVASQRPATRARPAWQRPTRAAQEAGRVLLSSAPASAAELRFGRHVACGRSSARGTRGEPSGHRNGRASSKAEAEGGQQPVPSGRRTDVSTMA